MTKMRMQFSLRQLLVVMTVVAIVVMLVTHHFRVVIGFVTVAAWLADMFFPLIAPFLESWLNQRG